jgi:hypothetical protein
MTTATRHQHRHLVSWLIVAIIAVVVLWSIINISATARHYHATSATWLLGVAFGLANAVSVYAWATAKTSQLRLPAILGAVLFGLGSAIIQTSLYRLEAAAWPVAIAFGAMGPLAEALLAWLEAAMRAELAAEEEASLVDLLRQQLATATADHSAATTTLQTQIADLQSALTTTTRQLAERQSHPPAAATADRQPAANLTASQLAKIRQVADLADQSGGFATDTELADLAGWSETTARRYRNLAEEQGVIHRNGDGRYHPIP